LDFWLIGIEENVVQETIHEQYQLVHPFPVKACTLDKKNNVVYAYNHTTYKWKREQLILVRSDPVGTRFW
jgi:hypothetical protein